MNPSQVHCLFVYYWLYDKLRWKMLSLRDCHMFGREFMNCFPFIHSHYVSCPHRYRTLIATQQLIVDCLRLLHRSSENSTILNN